MEYQKIANLLNDASNKPSKFRTRNQVEINDDTRFAYSPNKQIRFKTALMYISVNNTAGGAAAANNTNKKVIFKNCAPFTHWINKISNTQIDNGEYNDIVMPKYNLIQ